MSEEVFGESLSPEKRVELDEVNFKCFKERKNKNKKQRALQSDAKESEITVCDRFVEVRDDAHDERGEHFSDERSQKEKKKS